MKRIDLKAVVEECRRADSFLITTHAGPDGDAVGSMLAMRYFLNTLGKDTITCACHDPVPRVYDWLPGAGDIVDGGGVDAGYDLVVVLDVAQLERIASVGDRLLEGQRILVLDHHREDESCGTVNFIDPTYAAASEIVVELFDAAGLTITHDAAVCAYVGVTTDTGSFRFGNTNARAHRIAAKLIDAGIDVAGISARIFDVMSLPKGGLLRRVLERLEVSDCARYAWSYLEERDLDEAGALPEDVDGLVNFVRNLQGVQVAVLFRGFNEGKVKVSVRAREPLNAADLLRPLGGGGHSGAAGATMEASMAEAQRQVLEQVERALGAIPT